MWESVAVFNYSSTASRVFLICKDMICDIFFTKEFAILMFSYSSRPLMLLSLVTHTMFSKMPIQHLKHRQTFTWEQTTPPHETACQSVNYYVLLHDLDYLKWSTWGGIYYLHILCLAGTCMICILMISTLISKPNTKSVFLINFKCIRLFSQPTSDLKGPILCIFQIMKVS